MLDPSCRHCGSPLRACPDADWPRIADSLEDVRVPRKPRLDGAGPLALMIVGPWLLALAGVHVRDVIFAVPLMFLVLATGLAWSAARRPGEPALPWRAYALSAATAGAAIVAGGVLQFAGHPTLPAFQLGGISSALMALGLAAHLRPRIRMARPERLLDAVQLLLLVAAATVYFVVVPGLRSGDGVLTAVVAVDLVAFLLAGMLTACGRRKQDQRVGRRLWWMTVAGLVADALNAAAAAGRLHGVPAAELSAVGYAVSGWFLAGAAVSERPAPRPTDLLTDEEDERRWLVSRVLVPSAQLVAFPLLAGAAIDADGAGGWPLGWFGATFVAAVLAAFARQAYLTVDHRRAVIEERRQRRQAQARNQELEALTGLATTMTQTLEEAPIVEQALTVLHAAARASSSALHVSDGARRRLRASAGHWQSEQVWADRLGDGPEVERAVRGGRQLTRVPLAARGHDLGWVTLVRPAADPLGDRDLELLRLLVDQMAIAVQNARDYREKLEQAVRDPLTSVYNRRYFFEALEKEVHRVRRYGTVSSIVLFDVDDFKAVNDTRGHAGGDDVLRAIARIVPGLLRPSDSFARIGGEEFALLLPETAQMEALLIAERVRVAISRGAGVTISAGIGAFPQDAPTLDELMRATDAALYWAKRNGKDRCALATAPPTPANVADVSPGQ